MKPHKRYRAASVLPELVEFADGVIPTGPHARQLLAKVLRADTGFLVVGEQDLLGVNLLRLRREFRDFLRSGLDSDVGQKMPEMRVEIAPTIVGGDILMTVDGSAHDVLWFQIARILQTVGISSIRRCDCGRVFVKNGRREFCSARCQKRIYMKAYRHTGHRR